MPDLSLYKPPTSVGGIKLPSQTPKVGTAPVNQAASLSLGNPAGLVGSGISNQNLLPQNLRSASVPVSPITKAPASPFGSKSPAGVVSSGIDTNYQLLQGEDVGAYNSRIASYNAAKSDAGTLPPNSSLGYTPATLSNGSIVSTDGNGNVTSPSRFSIDTSGPISSDLLGSGLTRGDLTNTRKTYADYVQGLAQVTQYSPEYLAALEGVQSAQAKDAELQANFYTGRAPGDTVDYAQGSTARARQLNSLDALGAQQALQVQELVRSGNIEAAKALVTATAPTSVSPGSSLISPFDGSATYGGAGAYSDFQAQQTYFNLAQTYPDANIPPYDPALPAQTNYQMAQTLVAQSPSFNAKYTNIQQLAGGEVIAYNKTTGQYENIQTALQASTTTADSASLKEAQGYADTVQRSINTADANFTVLANLMKKAGINDTGSPISNQLENKFKRGVIGNGDIAAFNSVLASVRAEYAQVLSRGGGVTDTVRKEANELIPADISLSQLAKVKNAIHTEGENVIQQARGQVQAIQQRLSQPASTGGGSGSVWDF